MKSITNFPLSSIFAKEENEVINFIHIFFSFTYYLGISPFRISKQIYKGKNKNLDVTQIAFHLVKWRPQMVICTFLNILGIIRLLTELRLSCMEPGKYIENPIPYFQTILRIFAVIYKCNIMKRLWFNQDEFLQTLIYIKKDSSLPIPKMKIQNSSVIKLALSLCVANAIVDLFAGAYFVGPTWRWTPEWWFRQLLSPSRYTFFMGPKPKLDTAPGIEEISEEDVLLLVLTAIGLFQRYVLGLFCDICILSHVLTLWTVAHTFAQSISTVKKPESTEFEMHGNWNSIYCQYKAIRKLSQTINRALGNLVIVFMAEAIIFYSINLDVTVITEDVFKKGYMVYFYCNTFSILFISADICSQMDSLRVWLANDENRKNVPLDVLQIVLQELQLKDVGIRGGNIFTITYPLVASYCTLIVTYFIISVQHRNQLQPSALDG